MSYVRQLIAHLVGEVVQAVCDLSSLSFRELGVGIELVYFGASFALGQEVIGQRHYHPAHSRRRRKLQKVGQAHACPLCVCLMCSRGKGPRQPLLLLGVQVYRLNWHVPVRIENFEAALLLSGVCVLVGE